MESLKPATSSPLILIDFFAEWCGPCQTMEPVLEKFSTRMQKKIQILRIDIDQYPDAAFAYHISSVPTFLLYRSGEVLWRRSGLITLRDLEDAVHKFAADIT